VSGHKNATPKALLLKSPNKSFSGIPYGQAEVSPVNQHDGNVIPDLIEQFTLLQMSRFPTRSDRCPFAFGACQDVKKFFTDAI
jgi:hypothetical protein